MPRFRRSRHQVEAGLTRFVYPALTEPVSRTTYEVHAERDNGWWVLTVPAVPGAFSQARRLDQAPEMITDAIALVLGVPETSFAVTVTGVSFQRVAQLLADRTRTN
jgi:predicted RNase H-like HicB family nuclease